MTVITLRFSGKRSFTGNMRNLIPQRPSSRDLLLGELRSQQPDQCQAVHALTTARAQASMMVRSRQSHGHGRSRQTVRAICQPKPDLDYGATAVEERRPRMGEQRTSRMERILRRVEEHV